MNARSEDNASSVADRFLRAYCRLLEVVIAVCLMAMVVLVFGNVVLRYAFNSGISTSEELSRWFFVWLTFLGAVVALREHAHLGTEIVVARRRLDMAWPRSRAARRDRDAPGAGCRS